MRRTVVVIILAAGLACLAFLLFGRGRRSHVLPAVVAPSAAADAGPPDGGGPADAALPALDAGRAALPAAGPVKLRIVSTAWEYLLPSATFDETPKDAAAPAVTLATAVVDGMTDVGDRLLRGPDDESGADVALVPLVSFTLATERLRALDPLMFLAVEWSRGAEQLRVVGDLSLSNPPAGEVRLVSGPDESSTFFSLAMIDLAGVPPSRVRRIASNALDAKTAAFVASTGAGTGASAKLLLTTADARRFVPIVAVAPRAALEARPDAYAAFSARWLAAAQRAHADSASAARGLQKQQSAPNAMTLLERYGRYEGIGLRENAELLGLSGRTPVTLDELHRRAWAIGKGAGTLVLPAAEGAPVFAKVVTSLVRSKGVAEPNVAKAETAASKPKRTPGVFVRRMPSGTSENDAARELAVLATVFGRSKITVSSAAGERAARGVIVSAKDRFEVAVDRVAPGNVALNQSAWAFEVGAAE